MIYRFAISAFLSLAAAAAHAEAWSLVPSGTDFRKIGDRNTFVGIVADRELKRFGIKLEVNSDGTIGGNAFGQQVTGAWQWQDGFFCRELYWGSRAIGANCQEVRAAGDTLRFTSDRGTGDFADLRLN